jgi:hypothetical protein
MVRSPGNPDLAAHTSEHMCAFYNGSDSLNDIVVDYITEGLRANQKCFAMVDTPSSIEHRIPPGLASREGMLRVLTEDEGYMPEGHFAKETFVDTMGSMVRAAFDEGYSYFRAVGDESFIIRNRVDIGEWFAAEFELNKIVPDYPHFFFCLYDLELFDGDTVLHVLKTHPKIYTNGVVIANPHYTEADSFPD